MDSLDYLSFVKIYHIIYTTYCIVHMYEGGQQAYLVPHYHLLLDQPLVSSLNCDDIFCNVIDTGIHLCPAQFSKIENFPHNCMVIMIFRRHILIPPMMITLVTTYITILVLIDRSICDKIQWSPKVEISLTFSIEVGQCKLDRFNLMFP